MVLDVLMGPHLFRSSPRLAVLCSGWYLSAVLREAIGKSLQMNPNDRLTLRRLAGEYFILSQQDRFRENRKLHRAVILAGSDWPMRQ